MLIVFCVERPSEEGAPLGGGIELCGSSSYLRGLRSLLNTTLSRGIELYGSSSCL